MSKHPAPLKVKIDNFPKVQQYTNIQSPNNQKISSINLDNNNIQSTNRSSNVNTTTNKSSKLNDQEWQLNYIMQNLEKIQNSEYFKAYPALLKLVFSQQINFDNHTKQIKLQVYKSLLHCSTKICERYFKDPLWHKKDKHVQQKLKNVLTYAQLTSLLWNQELEDQLELELENQIEKEKQIQLDLINHLKITDMEQYDQKYKQIMETKQKIDPQNLFKSQFLTIPSYRQYLSAQLILLLNQTQYTRKCGLVEEYEFYIEKLKQFLSKFDDLIIKDYDILVTIDQVRIEIANYYFIQQKYDDAQILYDILLDSLQFLLQISLEKFEINKKKDNIQKKKKSYYKLNKIVYMLITVLLTYAELTEYQKRYTKYHETVKLGIFLVNAFKFELQHCEELTQKFQDMWEEIEEYHHPCTNKIKSDGEIRKIMTKVYGKKILEMRIEEQEKRLHEKDEIDQIMYKKYGYKQLNEKQFIIQRGNKKMYQRQKTKQIDPNEYTHQRHKSKAAYFNSSGNGRQSNSQYFHDTTSVSQIQSQSELDGTLTQQGPIQQFTNAQKTPKSSLQFQRKLNPAKIGNTPHKTNQSYMNSIQETNTSQQHIQSQQSEFQKLSSVMEKEKDNNNINTTNSNTYQGSTMLSPQSSTFMNQKKSLFTSPNNTNYNKSNFSSYTQLNKKSLKNQQEKQKPLVYISPNSQLQKHYYKDNTVELKDVKILTTDKYWYPQEMQKNYSQPFQNMTMLMKELPKQKSYFEYKVKPKLTAQNLNPEYLDLDVHFKQIIERKFNNQDSNENSDDENPKTTNSRKQSTHSRRKSVLNKTNQSAVNHSRIKSQPTIMQTLPFFYVQEGLEKISQEEAFDGKEFLFAKKQIKFRKTFTHGQRSQDIVHQDRTDKISKVHAYNEMEVETEFYEAQLDGENKIQEYKQFKEQKKKEELQKSLQQHTLQQQNQQLSQARSAHNIISSHKKSSDLTDSVIENQPQKSIVEAKSPRNKKLKENFSYQDFSQIAKQEITNYVHKCQDENVIIDQEIEKLKVKTHFEEGYELKTIPNSQRKKDNHNKRFSYFNVYPENPNLLSSYVFENKYHTREQNIRNKQIQEINKLQFEANNDVNNYLQKNKIANIGSNSNKPSKTSKLVQRLTERLKN